MWHRFFSETEVNRPPGNSGRLDRLPGLKIVSRSHNRDVVDRAQDRKIVKRMMGCTQRSIADPGADPDHTNRAIRITNIVLNLLKGACRKETSRRNGKYIFAGCGQTRCDPDQVLFRYTNF